MFLKKTIVIDVDSENKKEEKKEREKEENKEEKKEEKKEEEKEDKKEEKKRGGKDDGWVGITGNLIRGLTGLVVGEADDLEYENSVIVYIERDFGGTNYSVGDMIYLDPTLVTISSSDWITTSQLTNVTSEMGDSNHTHLNVSNSAPWDSLVGYWSFDGDLENTALTTAYDWSGEGNDGEYKGGAVSNSSGGKYGEGLVGAGFGWGWGLC